MQEVFNGLFKKININKNLIIFFEALISGCACTLIFGFKTSNIFALVFFILFYGLFKKAIEVKEKNIILCSRVLGFLFMFSIFLANLAETLKILPESYKITRILVYIFGFYFLFRNLTAVIYKRLLNFNLIGESCKYSRKYSIILFFVSMLVMLACWTPYLIKDFPGVMTYDSNNQLLQGLGEIPLRNHHPLVHTFAIKIFYELGMLLFGGNQTLAIATFSVCQMLLLSASFAYLIITLYKFRIKKVFIFIIIAFYSIMPYHGVFAITMWKDVWFGAIMLVLTTTLWRLIEYFKNNKKLPVFEFVMFVIFSIAMCLFRSNGWYAYIVLAPFVFFIFKKKNLCIALTALIIIPIVYIIKGPIYNSMNVIQPDTIESLSVPAQHIARAITDGAKLTNEQYDLLSKVVVVEEIPKRYKNYISDPIKTLVRETDNQEFIEDNKLEFLKLWIDLGIKNPSSYVLAQVDQTCGYWYPDVQYWVFTNQLYNENLECEKVEILSESTYEKFTEYMHSYKKVPYLGLLWSIGTFTWVFIFMLGFCFINRNKKLLLVYLPLLAILATIIIATPVYSEFRYIYSLFTTMPVFLVVPFIAGDNKKEITEEKARF